MSFKVNDIRSHLTFGRARAIQSQVQLTNPINGLDDLETPFMVQASSIPESTLGTIEVPYFGRKIKYPGDRTFAEWTVTVINDEDFLVRNAMEEWMASINSHEGNIRQLATAAAGEYKSQAQITQYSKTGIALRTYSFIGLYPSNIAAIDMNWETTDDIERFDVTFQYDYWQVTGGVTGTASTDT
mgnify:CR=1 FL=1